MPKRYKFNKKVSFIKESDANDEEKEPEHFKYGVYFNDGYNYMKHIISMDEFNDEEKDLKNDEENCDYVENFIVEDKNSNVIKEIEVNGSAFNEITMMEQLKEKANGLIDDDILEALNGDDICSNEDEDDDTYFDTIIHGEKGDVKETDHSNDMRNFNLIKSNPLTKMSGKDDIMDKFLAGEEYTNDYPYENNYEFEELKNCLAKEPSEVYEKLQLFDDDFDELINVIPKQYETYIKQLVNKSGNKINNLEPLTDEEMKQILDLQYEEDDDETNKRSLDNAISQWLYNRKEKITRNAMNNQPKLCNFGPTQMTIQCETTKKRKQNTSISIESSEGGDGGVDKFIHQPRKDNETAEEKRQRKKEIKNAKKARIVERKQRKELYDVAKRRV